MQQMSQSTKPASRWVKIGTATRQYSALRLEILIGPARGAYYISAADLGRLPAGTVPVYKVRTVKGEQLPSVAGFAEPTRNGAMVTIRIAGLHTSAMMPTQQLAQHLENLAANLPTTITAPREDVYSFSAQAVAA